MALHIPHALLNRMTRSPQPATTQTSNAIPLRQIRARPQQNAGGSLMQDGASSHPAPPLRQQAAPARQGSSAGMRSSLTRLRERLHRNASGRTSLPERPNDPTDTARFTRNSAQQRQPGGETSYTRASARARTPGQMTRPPAPPPAPRRSRLETIHEVAETAQELHQLSEAIRQSLPARSKKLESIPEEKHAELEKSKLNAMQQRAQEAAERDTAENKNILRPQTASLTLDEKGKLSVTDAVSDNLSNILKETVARPHHQYQRHEANADNSQHLLMDPKGRMLSLQGSRTAFVGLTQSMPIPGGKPDHGASLTQTLQNHGIAQPNEAVHSQLTGIYGHDREQGDGRVKELVSELIREHGGRLYRLDEEKMHWDQIDKDEEKSFGKLSKQANGMLFAIHDKKTLHNLTNGQQSDKFKEKITSYCADEKGAALLLLSDEKTAKQSVKLLNSLDMEKDKPQSLTLKTATGAFHATGISLHNNQLLAIGSNGKLYSAAAPQKGDSEVELQEDSAKTALLARQLGDKFAVEDFVSHGDGRLLALVKDTSNQRHVCALGADGQFKPEWNLSASLVMDHHEGLLRPRPLPQDVVDLGRLGQVMLHDGKVQAFNKNSQRWEASFENADSIKRGQDGQAYVLKDGIPSRVKVSLKSDSIGGISNQFTMRQMKSNLTLDDPLVGINSKNKASAIAPLDAERFVALSEEGELQFHRNSPGSRQPDKLMKTLSKSGIDNWLPATQPGTAESLPANGEGNTLTDIAMDQQQSLYALDKQGKLYTMAKDQWQGAQNASASWQPVPLPEGMQHIESLHNVADGSLMVADKDGRSATLQLAGHRLKAKTTDDEAGAASDPSSSAPMNNQNAQQVATANRWLVQPEYDPERKLEAKSHRRRNEKAWDRLDDATKSTRVMGMTMKREANLLGMTGRDGNHINSRLRDRLRAHVFNPTLSTPRPIKNASYAMQHSWQGREGLRPLYQHQGALHNEMKALLAQQPAAARVSMADRLTALESSGFSKPLLENLKQFSDSVTDSARHHTGLLGQHSGALQADRTVNPDFSPSRRQALTQAMNINSDDRNLVTDLTNLYQRYPMSNDHDSLPLMQRLKDQGAVVRHQKENPPLGRQRDPFDDMGLAKSRLILDGLTMSKLHQMMDEMERLAADPNAIASQSKDLQERFRVLRDETYGEDPVRKATNQGFVSHKQLEACYDAIKSMTNAFSKEHHGVNMTTRTVLKARDQAQMTERLHRTIISLETGENMGFGRNYGGQLTLSVIPGAEVIGVPGLRGNLDRAYNASFSRSDTGITVSFSRNGGGTGTAFGAVGWNPISLADNYKDIKQDLGNGRSLTPSARLGGMISAALQKQMQNNISFTISEAELESFIQQMTSGELQPQQLLDRGVGHQVKNGTTLTFNVDAALMAIGGGGVSIPTNSAEPSKNSATVRANIILQAGTNLASAQRERNVARNDSGETNGRSDNRMRMLNSASVSAGVMGGVGITTSAAANLRVPMFGVSSTNIQLSIDNRTKQSMSINMAKAEQPEQRQLDKLVEQIGLNFDDARLNELVQELKDADKPVKKEEVTLSAPMKQLKEQSLRHHFDNPEGKRPLTKAEHTELEKLAKKELDDRQPAAGKAKAADSTDKPKKLNTYQLDEKQAVRQKLDKLTAHLLTMTPANNGQYAVINSAKQLKLQQQAADLHCQGLNSAEYQTTYNNLHKIDSNNLMHVLHNLIASELPPSNAERISGFMEQKPMLKEVIKDLQKHSDTQAVVTLEMKDGEKINTQQLWLDHRTQPEDIRKQLHNRNNLRIKSIAFTETNSKPEGINIPFFVTGGSSSANVSMSRNLGKINFSYGEDQETPHSFSLEGEIAVASNQVVDALTNAEVQDKRGVV